MSRRKTLDEWQLESDIIHNKEFTILEEPNSGSHNVKILHKKCGNIISMKLNNHIKRYCAFCSGKNKKSFEEYQKKSNFVHVIETHVLQHYVPINHWHGKKGYDEQVYRDKIKEDYLIKKNIRYIILNNKELTKIKEII